MIPAFLFLALIVGVLTAQLSLALTGYQKKPAVRVGLLIFTVIMLSILLTPFEMRQAVEAFRNSNP